MAELLVRTIDKVNVDSPYADVKCTKRGDVIAICEDGHPWSDDERNAPFWKIIKAPGVDPEKLSAYVAAEAGDPLVNKMLQRRAFKFDLDTYAANKGIDIPSDGPAHDSEWKAAIDSGDIPISSNPAGGSVDLPDPTLDITEAEALALKVEKPALKDPNVLADDVIV